MAKGTSIVPVASTASPSADPTSSRTQRKTRAFGTTRNNTKLGTIAPAGPTAKQLNLESQRILGRGQIGALSFGQAYGVLGVPMLCILFVCIAWTSWLIFLALAPNTAANLLMGTSSYDNGEFWLITDINPHMTFAGAVGLIVVSVCYSIVTLRMLFWRDKLFGSAFSGHPSTFTTSRRGRVSWLSSVPRYRLFRNRYEDLTAYEGKNRKKWNAFLKLVDIAMETVMLRQLLQNGSPMVLTSGFAGFLAANALSCAINVLTDRFSALTEVFIDSINAYVFLQHTLSFDLSAAVLFPIGVLLYCYYDFDFDREVYLTYREKLPPGSFEHLARSFASPSKIALFRVNFDSLRISSALDFMLRMSMNLTFCYRFERVLEALVWTRHRDKIVQRLRPHATPDVQQPVPKGVTIVFVAVSLIVLLSTQKAMSDSATLCSVHPECVVFAHQWVSSDENCPCLIAIDIDIAPKTYDEWINPIDTYGKVKSLAAAGMLTSLQVINRQLLELPDELRRCSNLRVIYLMYTSIQRIPSWIKDLHHLETLQIEGKYGNSNLLGLPENLFGNFPRLTTIHLGIHENIDHIPPLTGVPNLQSLSLSSVADELA